ncbi:ABC transporter permease [Litoribacter populi]|uniref:ABC transporter permease n=1 Tax=Litoribacter populi TaxID=2598460 RepID=UPI00117E74A6|nr:ABC transporter permease [Litoribacter populi]
MLKNYFIIAARNLAKYKFFTSINVFCLALGLSLNLLFIAMLTFLFTYDNFHPNKDEIYRVVTQVHDKEANPKYSSAPVGLVSRLRNDFPGIERVVPIQKTLKGDALYLEKEVFVDGYFVDSEFLKTFNFPLLKGNIASALTRPNTIVISETLSTKIFGSEDPIGEMIKINPEGDYLVTGVMKDLPTNSHMQFEALASLATLSSYAGGTFSESKESWDEFINSYIYLLLPQGEKPTKIQDYLNVIAKEKYGEHEDFKASFELQALNKIVPGPDLLNSIGPKWDYTSLILVGLITLIILVPACFNYINLSIAQSLNRMREIGVRKVMGGSKNQIFFQFIMETTLMMLMASVLSFFIFELIREESMKYLGDLLDLTPDFLTVVYFFMFILFVGFVAGFIPALYFSKISPVNTLKGKIPKSNKNSFPMQKIVIAVQFVLSIGFIMAVVIIIQQYRFSVNYSFEFEQENILNMELQDVDPQIVKNEFGKLASVNEISMSSHLLGIGSTHYDYLRYADESDSLGASYMFIDENFIPNMDLKFLAGGNFGDQAGGNQSYIIVNEEFVKKLDIAQPHMAINRNLFLPNGRTVVIGGVVENFHYSNLMDPINSFFFKYDPEEFAYANLHLSSREDFKDLAGMEEMWKNLSGTKEFKAQFYNHQINDVYGFYFEIIKLWGFLGLLAITVACLGLLGTVVFTIKNRLKEVSIKKVLGASTENLIFALSKDYIKLMVIASLIAVPVTYLLFDNLLPNVQHYSIKIGFIEVFVSLLLVAALGLTTVFSQTLKAAQSNPVDNLKSE